MFILADESFNASREFTRKALLSNSDQDLSKKEFMLKAVPIK